MMQNEKVTLSQAVYTIVLFNFGSSVIMGINTSVNQDAWLPIIIATALSVPVFFIYSRILKLFPEKNLFEISEVLLGKVGGKIITVMFIWYSIHLAALVLRNFSEFTQISSMPETPQLPIMILMITTTIYLARSSMRAIGKWSVAAIFLASFVVIFTFVASIHQVKLSDLLPFMEHPPAEIAKTSFQIFSFPYAETVIFLCVGGGFHKENKPFKMFSYALLMILIVFLLVFFRNLTLLGRSMMAISFFPSYVTARIIEIGDFLARIEGSISSNFLLAGIVKISVCLLAAAKGLSNLFKLKGYRPMVLPVGMIVLALCSILYKNTMDMFIFIEYYPYYALPFQIIIPLIICILGEVYARKQKNKQ